MLAFLLFLVGAHVANSGVFSLSLSMPSLSFGFGGRRSGGLSLMFVVAATAVAVLGSTATGVQALDLSAKAHAEAQL